MTTERISEIREKALAKAHDQICQLTNELEDYRHRIRALILERDRFQHLAEQKLGLRRELEELLGMNPGQPCSDEVFQEGVNRLRALVTGHQEWKRCAYLLAAGLFRNLEHDAAACAHRPCPSHQALAEFKRLSFATEAQRAQRGNLSSSSSSSSSSSKARFPEDEDENEDGRPDARPVSNHQAPITNYP